jgi:hypothetical protein
MAKRQDTEVTVSGTVVRKNAMTLWAGLKTVTQGQGSSIQRPFLFLDVSPRLPKAHGLTHLNI